MLWKQLIKKGFNTAVSAITFIKHYLYIYERCICIEVLVWQFLIPLLGYKWAEYYIYTLTQQTYRKYINRDPLARRSFYESGGSGGQFVELIDPLHPLPTPIKNLPVEFSKYYIDGIKVPLANAIKASFLTKTGKNNYALVLKRAKIL